jgi:geranylgeranyl diphosphate synthase type II
MRPAEELRDAVEAYLRSLAFAPELGSLDDVMRYSFEAGGKRIRPVLCLAVAETAGGSVEDTLPAAASIELVHTFSLVHDDLPALDDDIERRGRESTWVAFDEAAALLAGDALLAEAVRLALTYDSNDLARELLAATLGMIGGQYRELAHIDDDLAQLHRLKTGRLFRAAIRMGLLAARVDPDDDAWGRFADTYGLLFQVVDDIHDRDGYVEIHGLEAAELRAAELDSRARADLEVLDVDTSVLGELVDALMLRTG